MNKTLNDGIKGNIVFLVDTTGNRQVYKDEAIELAQNDGFDLVQVGKNKDGVPMCKILDYSKYMYNQKKNLKGNIHKAATIKEIRITLWIAEHDMKVKANNIDRLVKEGHKVKLMLAIPKRIQPSEDTIKVKMYKLISYMSIEVDTQYVIDGYRREIVIEKKLK